MRFLLGKVTREFFTSVNYISLFRGHIEITFLRRPDLTSWVGMASRYSDLLRAGQSGIESLWERDFPHPSRPTLGPTQSPIQWVPCLSQE